MSILSDITISALCAPLESIFDQIAYDKLVEAQNEVGWPMTLRAQESVRSSLRLRASRAPTDEERLAHRPMIAPFETSLIREIGDDRKIISAGLSSYGYDARLAREIKIFTNSNATIIDPKRMSQHSEKCLVPAAISKDEDGAEYFILPPNSYALGYTIEYFRMPRDVTAIVLGKSTYARAGLQVNATPIEAGFEGTVVLELANSTTLPMMVYVNEGIAQFLFFKGDRPCKVSYEDRGGKYHRQRGLELSKV